MVWTSEPFRVHVEKTKFLQLRSEPKNAHWYNILYNIIKIMKGKFHPIAGYESPGGSKGTALLFP